jgi:hypothetical protein
VCSSSFGVILIKHFSTEAGSLCAGIFAFNGRAVFTSEPKNFVVILPERPPDLPDQVVRAVARRLHSPRDLDRRDLVRLANVVLLLVREGKRENNRS